MVAEKLSDFPGGDKIEYTLRRMAEVLSKTYEELAKIHNEGVGETLANLQEQLAKLQELHGGLTPSDEGGETPAVKIEIIRKFKDANSTDEPKGKGGDEALIYGMGFQQGVHVHFGNIEATDIRGPLQVHDNHHLVVITCRVPPAQSAGKVAVKVQNPDGTSDAMQEGWEYIEGEPGQTDPSLEDIKSMIDQLENYNNSYEGAVSVVKSELNAKQKVEEAEKQHFLQEISKLEDMSRELNDLIDKIGAKVRALHNEKLTLYKAQLEPRFIEVHKKTEEIFSIQGDILLEFVRKTT